MQQQDLTQSHGVKPHPFTVKISRSSIYTKFVLALTGALSKKLKVEWQHRPFSRIVTWGRDFRFAADYVQMNELESFGLIPYKARTRYGPGG